MDATEASYKDFKDTIEVPREKIAELIKEFTSTKQFCEWTCDRQGANCVYTATKTYSDTDGNVQFGNLSPFHQVITSPTGEMNTTLIGVG